MCRLYGEKASEATTIEQARAEAMDSGLRHAFQFNDDTNTGYLVSDLNADGVFETGVRLEKAGFAAAMDWSYILA